MTDSPSNDPKPRREDFASNRSESLAKLDSLRRLAFQKKRVAPSAELIARRRSLLALAKWALPSLALVLLASIAAWPEISHLINQNRAALREMARLRVESGNMENAVYRGLDAHNHLYMITAHTTHQEGPDRVNLVDPVADIQLSGNSWAHIKADRGVYMQHEQTLDLDDHVVLYRDDGTLMNGPSADLDLKQGVVASRDWVHAEGPFGTEDAQGYFMDQHAGLLEFTGPGQTVRNDDFGPAASSVAAQKRP
ncbi:LPS export ABC transporter periplasmic protein LptC [Gluconobacter wancherniae]|uniref:LPS export ABC transporter periplasmic protein LptC n=1 Tax=Gluconobacter wancherniae TaxID=1307955 RepID=UPI001B8B9E7F|nr:LPS export ABC transporter periplasmic protein LptC [Gluconobacter wancherniae]MBS1093479.1 LPS export ABC transporter periplasmic protein LptC [Gluconobacter wancherniae]